MRVREPSVKLKSAVLEALYLAWLGLFLVRAFEWTTMFKVKWSEEFMWWVTATGFAIAFLRAAVGSFEALTERLIQNEFRKNSGSTGTAGNQAEEAGSEKARKKQGQKFFDDYGVWMTWQMLLAVLLALFMIRNYHRFETDQFMLMTLAAILGAKGIDFRKIAAVFFAVTAVFLLITIHAARAGKIENLVYLNNKTHNFKPRIAYGIVYPTDFAAHVFFTGTAWVWMRGKRITYAEIAVIFAAGWFVYAKNDAWMTTGLLVILGLALIYFKIRERGTFPKARSGKNAAGGETKEKAAYRLNGIVSNLLTFAAPICAAVIIILSCIYRKPGENRWINTVDKMLHHRLKHASRGLKGYPVKWFGRIIPINGLGGTTERPKDYFFLDSSYTNILLRYGIGLFILVIGIWVYVSFREKQNGEWQRLLVLGLIAAACFMEHHFMEIAYNPYLLLVFAASGSGQLRKREKTGLTEKKEE